MTSTVDLWWFGLGVNYCNRTEKRMYVFLKVFRLKIGVIADIVVEFTGMQVT